MTPEELMAEAVMCGPVFGPALAGLALALADQERWKAKVKKDAEVLAEQQKQLDDLVAINWLRCQ
jgi:hypothetical protein